MYENDNRIVMTLDAGGTNFVFSAIQGNREIVPPLTLAACSDDLLRCLGTIVEGFEHIKAQLPDAPVAISFAFPGPADYLRGVIGDLPNFPCFRGGVPLGPYLEEHFGLPVFINNDGNLFAYGEAIAGSLPYVNRRLRESGSEKQYFNLLGITLGTGFGAGVVINGELLLGDNGCGGDVWVFRNKKYPHLICEESVSIRAVKRVYAEISGEDASSLTPKDIFDIAEETRAGDKAAAVKSFEEFGEVAANTISQALTIVDGLVVIGGGLTGAGKYFMPALIREMNGRIGMFSGEVFPRLQMVAHNLEEDAGFAAFAQNSTTELMTEYTAKPVFYDTCKKTGVIFSHLGTSKAVALGAYAYALKRLG